MNKKSKVLLIVCFVLIFLSDPLMGEDQYEYMVISLGENYFSKTFAKTYAYYDEMPAADHALLTEMQLDILGKHSWEVIGMLGTIGGDQQITLKRVYDADRTNNELAAIEENKKKAQAKESQISDESTLIDLDAKEATELEVQRKATIEQDITQKLMQVLDDEKVTGFEFIWEKESIVSKKTPLIDIDVMYDVTDAYLLGKNTYRKSQVEAYLAMESKKVISIIEGFSERPKWVSLYAYITYDDQQFLVGSKGITYYKYSNTWNIY